MPHVIVGEENSSDIRLYYEDHGEGQPVVMIHGFPLSGDAWEKQKLALVGNGYRVITYDRRGFGQSDKPATGYDYDTLTADLAMIIDELDLQDVVLIGHSMGTGEVARYIARYDQDNVDRAVFISPLLPYLLKTDDNPDGVDLALFNGIQEAITEDRYAYLTEFFRQFYNLDQTLGSSVSEEVVRASWNSAAIASPRGTYDCVGSWLTDFRADVARITIPTLIIHGTADRVLPIDATARVLENMLANTKLIEIKDAPHGIPWTHGRHINRALLSFLADRAQVPATEEDFEAIRIQQLAFREQIDATDSDDEDLP